MNSYPQGQYAALAEVARQKVQREAVSREKLEAGHLAALKKQEASETGIGKVVKDCNVCPEMVVVPAGNYSMGSNDGSGDEKPVHQVNISSFFVLYD